MISRAVDRVLACVCAVLAAVARGQTTGPAAEDRARLRRRDKSGSPVVIQALVKACLSPCWSVGSRAAPGHKINEFNGVCSTDRYPPRIGWPR